MEPQASQSKDCEPTPPLQKHNSGNFYLPSIENETNLNNGSISTGTGIMNNNTNNFVAVGINSAPGEESPHQMRMYQHRHSPHTGQR